MGDAFVTSVKELRQKSSIPTDRSQGLEPIFLIRYFDRVFLGAERKNSNNKLFAAAILGARTARPSRRPQQFVLAPEFASRRLIRSCGSHHDQFRDGELHVEFQLLED
jgi:hypothetical protein